MHEILVDSIGDITISVYIKEKVLWDIEIDNPNFPLQPTGIYEFKVDAVDKESGIAYLNSCPHQAVTTFVKNLSTGDKVNGRVLKYFSEQNKNPEVEITDEAPRSPLASHEVLAQKYAKYAPKIVKEQGILEIRDYFSQILTLNEVETPLSNGGLLSFEPTKAVFCIDIDKNTAEGVMKTNLLAAREIARQITLRKIGGLVAIDFLRLKDKKHQDDLDSKFRGYFKENESRIDFYGFSKSGLYEFAKERLGIPTSLHMHDIEKQLNQNL